MKKENRINILLILIILVGFILRFVKIPNFPPALNWDEVSHGYNAYSIYKTGADEWGVKFPILNFRAYGDYPLPLNLYLTIPSIAIFGLNVFSIRLPHLILGVLTIISSYYLIYGITKKKNISLLTSFLVAIGPWYLFTSHIVLQSNISVFLLITSLTAFFNRERGKYLLPLSILFLFLTLFSYHTTRIFSPLLLISLIVIYRSEFLQLFKTNKYYFIGSSILVFIFFIVLFPIFINSSSRARSQWVFLVDQGAINKIIEERQNSKLPYTIKRIIFNRPTYFVKEFTKNYLGYFSPDFLFLKGGTQYQFSLPNKGLLHLINLPFFYIGLIVLFINTVIKKEKNYQLVFIWLILAPIPAAITNEKFAVLRSTTMLPLPEFLSALGLFYILDLLKKKDWIKGVIVFTYLLGIFLGFENYLNELTKNYPAKYSWAWQYGYKEVIGYVKDNYEKFDKIIVTKKYGEPHEFFLFYGAAGGAPWPWDPQKYRQDNNLVKFYQSGWYWVDSFDKFYFINDWQIKEKEKEKGFILESGISVNCQKIKCLLVTSPNNFPAGWKKVKTINFLDGKSAFEIYSN